MVRAAMVPLLALALAGCDYERLTPDDLDGPSADALDVVDARADATVDGPAPDGSGPQLASSEIPLRIAVDSTVSVRLLVQGLPSTQLGWSVVTGGGGFTPTSGTVTLSGTGLGVIAAAYTAPGSPDDYAHTLTLDDGAAHQHPFTTLVRTPSAIGNATSFPDAGGLQVTGGFLFGQELAVSSPVVVLRLGLFSDNASASGRLALYTSAGNAPGTLVANTAVAAITTGRTEFDVTTPVLLEAGTYWIMGNFGSGAQVRRAPGDVAQAYVAQQVTDALPTTIASSMSTTGRGLNFYAMVTP